MKMRPAVFLDRDGVLIEERCYLGDVEEVCLHAGAAEAVRDLNQAGFAVVVVTNQAGVAKGYFPEARVREIHDHLARMLAECRARIDRFYFCPHHPQEGGDAYRMECSCRKPKPGMLRLAAHELDLDLSGSWMIGDRVTDLQAGAAAGCQTMLVRTGYGMESESALPDGGLNFVGCADDLRAAVSCILKRTEVCHG